MTSSRDRQRAAARARLEREMALRAEAAATRRKRLLTVAGAAGAVLAVALVVVIVVNVAGDDDKKPAGTAAPSGSASAKDGCAFGAEPTTDPSGAPVPRPTTLKDVGTPPSSPPKTGSQTMTMTTNLGVIKIAVNTEKAPCTAASFTHLAGKDFFDNTECHRMTTSGIHVLQCGDPSATGTGGPTYRFGDENLPENRRPAYPAGTVAMANSGPGTNGSQFFIVYKDTELPPNYTIFGRVIEGLAIVEDVAKAGVTPGEGGQPGDGKPNKAVRIQDLTLTAPQ